jgi:glycosyltransferase involved in cell wall biosynthesis
MPADATQRQPAAHATTASKPRLVYLTNSDWIGGMERIVVNASAELTARGWTVRSLFVETPRSAALLEWAQLQGFAAESSRALLSYFEHHSYRKMLALRRVVARTRADIVHLHVGSNFLPLKDVLAMRLSGTRTCFASIHSAETWHSGNLNARRKTRLAAALCDGFIAHSTAVKSVLLSAGVPPAKVHLAPLGLRPPEAEPSRDLARDRLGIQRSAFVISTNSRLVKHKGTADLIQAVAQLPDPGREVVLLIAGEGPERNALDALGRSLLPGRCRLLGHVSDHTDLYAASDVFAMPTHDARESFGLVFIEAAFHAVPSVGTTVGGIPEAIANGQTGLLVEPRAPHDLAAALQRLRDEVGLRERLGSAARARAHATFTVKQMADRYEQIYLAACRRSTRIDEGERD